MFYAQSTSTVISRRLSIEIEEKRKKESKKKKRTWCVGWGVMFEEIKKKGRKKKIKQRHRDGSFVVAVVCLVEWLFSFCCLG